MEDDRSYGFAIQGGFSGAPVWDDELKAVVGITVAAESDPARRTAYMIPSDVLLKAWPQLGEIASPPSPYRGLDAFREEDQERFFGREEVSERTAARVGAQPVTTVVGPSGAGKSSLVFAGVLPKLGNGRVVISVRPRADFAAELGTAFQKVLGLAERPDIAATIGSDRTADVVDQVLGRTGDDELLIVIDQFEELFAQDAAAVDLMADLLRACREPTARLRILLTLRGDHLDRALGHAGLASGIGESVVTVGAMSLDQLRAAVIGPLPSSVRCDRGLVDEIVADVGAEPGQLSPLQFTLDRLWRVRRNNALTLTDYADLGGVAGALAQHADSEWAKLTDSEKNAGRRLLLRLVRLESNHPPTRVTVPRTTLTAQEWAVAERLAATRLVVTDANAVELAHEALISHWSQLRDWVDADKAFVTWLSEVQSSVGQWTENDRDPELLLSGKKLARARLKFDDHRQDVPLPLQEYIHRSVATARRATVRRRFARGGLAVVLIVTFIVAPLITITQQREARERAIDAARVLSTSINTSREPPAISSTDVLKAVAAYRTYDLPESRQTLFAEYAFTRGVERMLSIPSDPERDDTDKRPAVSADGRLIAAAGHNGIRLWRPAPAPPTDLPFGPIADLTMTPDGTLLAVAASAGNWLWLYDIRSSRLFRKIPLPPDTGRVVALSPNGRTVAVGSVFKSHIRVWDTHEGRLISTWKPPTEVKFSGNTLIDLSFNTDGRTLIIDRRNEVRRWDVRTGASHIIDTNSGATVSSDGSTLVTSRSHVVHCEVTVRTLARSEVRRSFALGHSSCGFTLAIDPTGRFLMVGLDVYDLKSGSQVATYSGRSLAPVLTMAPDGLRITATYQNSVYVYPIRFGTVENFPGFDEPTDISSDGRLLLTGRTRRGGMDVWDRQSGRRLGGTRLPAPWEGTPRFDASGRYVLVTYKEKSFLDVYEAPTARHLYRIQPPGVPQNAVPVVGSAHSGRLVISSAGRVTTWDLATGTALGSPLKVAALGRTPGFALLDGGSTLVTIQDDGQGFDIWDFPRRTKIGAITLPGTNLVDVGAIDEPRRLLVLSRAPDRQTYRVDLWALKGQRPQHIRTLTEYSYMLTGNRIGSGLNFDAAGVLRSYDLTDGHIRSQLRLPARAYAGRPALSDDGKLLFVRAFSGLAILSTNPDDWARELCRLVGNRTFTPEERKQLPPGTKTSELCPQEKQ
jgi:WD40 repeat protein